MSHSQRSKLADEWCTRQVGTHADDTALYMTHTEKDIALKRIQQCIPHIESWYNNWLMKLNTDKSKALLIDRSRNKPPEENVLVFFILYRLPFEGT